MSPDSSYKLQFQGLYYDGRSARRHDVEVTLTRDSLRIDADTFSNTITWLYPRITQVKDIYSENEVRLQYGQELPEILIIRDKSFIGSLRSISPQFGRNFSRHGSDKRIKTVAYVFIALFISAVLLHKWIVPPLMNIMVEKFPVTWEEKIGKSFISQISKGFGVCEDERLNTQIDKIKDRLGATLDSSKYKYNITIVNNSLVNAFALPGGEIILFRGLIEKSNRPEEVAGVVAHEIQHIEQRHFTKILIKELSIGIFLGLMIGDSQVVGTALNYANMLRSLAYKRSEESSSDAEGMKMLIKAGIDPKGMVDFFEIMKKEYDGTTEVSEYLSTHPNTENRIEKLNTMIAQKQIESEKLLPNVDWEKTKMLCQETKEQQDVKMSEEDK
ncbi:MAG TPA: M48 family metallopeptidase [Thermodesulfobacteriota bacterium]|nr:M48 family metallopeptidase [Thermodesulfobacteriota bacterium]